MAEFEELKLTVTLVDDASTGLTNIRTQLTSLTQTAGQVSTALSGVATSAQQVGRAGQQAAPHIVSQEKALKDLGRSAEETTRGMLGMALAARRGAAAFPELALATREAWTGLRGVNAGMLELGAASRLMVVGLASVTVGIAAVGAAVVAYGISVFKFSKEMYTLSQTAKSLGMTFGTLKAVTEQNERFGVSVDTTISGLAKMSATMADLSVSGSQLRQQMIGMGVPPQRIDELLRETDVIKRRNMVIGDQIKIENDLKQRMGPEAAAEWANRYGQMFGVDPGARTRPLQQPLTQEEKNRAAEIERQSREIAVIWAEILKHVSDIKEAFLAWGLPTVNQALQLTLTLMEKLNISAQGWATYSWNAVKALTLGPTLLIPGVRKWAFPGEDGAGATTPPGGAGAAPAPAAPSSPSSGFFNSPNRSPRSGYRPTSFGDGFGSDSGSGTEDRLQNIIKGGVYDALVEFYTFIKTGGTGGGSGIVPASFGGSAGAASAGGGGGSSGFGSAEFPNLGGGANAAGGAGIPSGLGRPNGSHVGAGSGDGAGDSPAGAPGGGGDTSKVGNEYLASQRARLKKEMDDNPELKRRFAAIIQTENPGAGTAVAESAMNRAAMTGRSLSSILQGGPKSFYGPARRGQIEPTMRNMSAKDLAARYRQIDEASSGSNQIRGHTDQGSAGDPNYTKGGVGVNINRERFNDWGGFKGVENSRRWREAQQAQVNKSAAEAAATAKAAQEVKESANVPGAAAGASPNFDERFRGESGGDSVDQNPNKRLYVSPSDRRSSLDRGAIDQPLDRSALNDNNKIHSTGKLDVNVNAPAGTKVAYSGENLLKNTSMQRQTQMMPTSTGPTAADTAQSYMRGGT